MISAVPPFWQFFFIDGERGQERAPTADASRCSKPAQIDVSAQLAHASACRCTPPQLAHASAHGHMPAHTGTAFDMKGSTLLPSFLSVENNHCVDQKMGGNLIIGPLYPSNKLFLVSSRRSTYFKLYEFNMGPETGHFLQRVILHMPNVV